MSEPRADRVQIELLRQAGPERRVALAEDMSATVIAWAYDAIVRRYPDLDEIAHRVKFIEVHYGADLARSVERELRARR